jgi:hypothetical protein
MLMISDMRLRITPGLLQGKGLCGDLESPFG